MSYTTRKEREAARQRDQARAARDIAPLPRCKDRRLKRRCVRSLRVFGEQCFAMKLDRCNSPDHLKAIAKMQSAIENGDLFALSMPRGSGKTTWIIIAVIWALVCGHSRYIALVGPTAKHAKKMLRTIKVELETNEKLLELFPETVHGPRRLERIANRARGQLYEGKATYIEWGKEQIVLPTIPGNPSSGAIVETAGITGSIRGMQYTTPGGETLRPDLLVIDDPQTKKSAKSVSQCDDRLETIQGDCLGLAGPGKAIAGFLLCTVIRKGDVADQLLDRANHPAWGGERYRLIYEWPSHPEAEKLWYKYATILNEELAAGRGMQKATEFYTKNRAKMDKGARVAWEERYNADAGEISALQHVYNLLTRDERAFWAEFQNDPKDPAEDSELLTVEQIQQKLHGYGRQVLPPACNTVTGFVDIQGKVLYWLVAGWDSETFTGWVLDYGTWPDQNLPYYTLASVRHTLARKYPRTRKQGRIRAGLFDLWDYLFGQTFTGPAGQSLQLQRLGIDAGWGEMQPTTKAAAAEHKQRSRIIPCYGKGIGPKQKPIDQWPAVAGESKFDHGVIRPEDNGHVKAFIDTNYWKTFLHTGLSTAIGDPGSLSLFEPSRRGWHKMLAEQLRSETRSPGDVDTWTLPSNKPDNHLFDCLSNAAAIASSLRVRLAGERVPLTKQTRRRRRGRRISKLAA